MDKIFKLAPEMKITLKAAGDLSLVVGQPDQLLIRTSQAEQINVVQGDSEVRVFCLNDAEIEVPADIPITVEKVSGDLVVVDSITEIRAVGGDVAITGGSVALNRVGGDVLARDVQALQVRQCGGDFTGRDVGDLSLENVGGDVFALTTSAHGSINIGGDLVLVLGTVLEDLSVRVGGDVKVFLPSGINCNLSLLTDSSDVELNLGGVAESLEMESQIERVLGEGGPKISIIAGGDVMITDQSYSESGADDIFSDLDVELDSMVEDISREVRIDERVAARLDSAARRAEEAARRAEQRIQAAMQRVDSRHGMMPVPPIPPLAPNLGGRPPLARKSASNEERLLILQMLAEQKITVEEAEQLLQALEGVD